MRHKGLLHLLLPPVLLCSFLLPVFAEAGAGEEAPASLSAKVETGYYLDGTLSVFAAFPGYVPEFAGDTPAAALLADGVQTGETEGIPMAETAPDYLLLVDCSGSMRAYRTQAEALAAALLENAPGASVAVAAFGDSFRVTGEHLTDTAALREALGSLSYNDQGTDICGGAVHAIEYMKTEHWTPGGLTNIVLLTDGEPYYTGNSAEEAEREQQASRTLSELTGASPQVVLHAVSFADWEPVTHDAVCSGPGLDIQPRDTGEAAAAGEAIAEYYAALYRLDYPLEHWTEELALRLSPTEIATVRRARDLTAQEEPDLSELPTVTGAETLPEPEPEPPEEPELPADTEPAETKPEPPEPTPEIPTETAAPAIADTPAPAETAVPEPEERPAAPPEDTEAPAASEAEPEQAENTFGPLPEPIPEYPPSDGGPGAAAILLVACAAVLLILVVVLLVLLLRKKKNAPAAPSNPAAAPAIAQGTAGIADAIPLAVEICGGALAGQRVQLSLRPTEALMLGSDARCDLVLPDGSVSQINSRIYRQGQGICIEDMNSAFGTAVGGMRIYAPNLLRSGDSVLVGDVEVRIYF